MSEPSSSRLLGLYGGPTRYSASRECCRCNPCHSSSHVARSLWVTTVARSILRPALAFQRLEYIPALSTPLNGPPWVPWPWPYAGKCHVVPATSRSLDSAGATLLA